jgi:hypothetical protein
VATHVLNNAYVAINSVDLSNHIRSVEFTVEADEQDNTAMGNGGYASFLTGLKTATVELECNQDYAAGSVYATLFPLFGTTGFPVAIRPDAGAIAATNPEWQGSGALMNLSLISGSVGQTNTTPVTIKIQGAITADVTP